MPVNPDGVPCRCGSIGCWETEVGGAALLRRAGHSPEGGTEAMQAVMAEAEAGSPLALAALDETGRWLGIGIAGLINLLNPELIRHRRAAGAVVPIPAVHHGGGTRPAGSCAPRVSWSVSSPTALGMDAPAAWCCRIGLRTPAGRPGGLARRQARGRDHGQRMTVAVSMTRPSATELEIGGIHGQGGW